MGVDLKYGRVTTAHGDIPEDEPVIVFRASDKLLAPLLSEYHKMCDKAGSPPRHLLLVEANYTRVADWQEAHADRVRTPDSERSRAWMGDKP